MQNITETGLSTISNKIVETAHLTSIQSWVFVNF